MNFPKTGKYYIITSPRGETSRKSGAPTPLKRLVHVQRVSRKNAKIYPRLCAVKYESGWALPSNGERSKSFSPTRWKQLKPVVVSPDEADAIMPSTRPELIDARSINQHASRTYELFRRTMKEQGCSEESIRQAMFEALF